jgi:DNA polymerase I
VTVTGRGNVDGYQMAQRDLPGVKVQTLERVAEHLGVEETGHDGLDSANMAEIWDDPERREALLAYAEDDAVMALGIAENLLPLQVGLCQRTYQDLSDGSRMGRGRQADWYLLAEAHRRGILAPDKRAHQGSADYEGGVVLEPPAGIHEDVVYLDFSSMYPSIMVAYNISPDTYVPREAAPEVAVDEAPEVGHRFRTEPDGFFKRLLEQLIDRRNGLKDEMADLPADSQERHNLEVEEQAVKVLTNAFYGYMGWSGARWQSVPCAEATTAWGRHFIQRAVEMADDMGLEVLYGDTDSVMIASDPAAEAFITEVNEELPIELEVEAHFDTLFFTGAKKRYAGRTKDGETIVRGLEVRRGDWCEYAKDVQQEVIDTLLTEQDPDQATRFAKDAVQALRDGEVPLDELRIYKTLTMDPEDYSSKQPHAMAVQRAREQQEGFEAPIGSKIGYVIVDDGDLVSERARLIDFLDEDEELDADYYIDKQVVPAAHRVLSYFGVDEDELAGRPSQASLKEWSS